MSDKKAKKIPIFRSLRVTLSLAFLIFNFSILLVAISLGAYFNFLVEKESIASQQNLIARDSAHLVENFIANKIELLAITASLNNLASSSERNVKLALTKILADDPSVRQTILLDAADNEIARVSRTSENASKEINDKLNIDDIMAQTKDLDKAYYSPVYVYETTSEPMIVLAVPVHDIFKDYSGSLLAEVNLKFMWDIIDRLDSGNGDAYVVDRGGKLLAYKDTNRVLKNENLRDVDEVKEFMANEESSDRKSATFSTGLNGDLVTATHVPLLEPDWAVVIETPVRNAYDAMVRWLSFELLVVLLGLIIIWLGGSMLSKKITDPIISLRDAVTKISGGNLDAKIDIKSKNEIGQLASAFNEMTVKLDDSYSSLEKKVRERTTELERERGGLEKKVRERTTELERERGSLEKKVRERTTELEQLKTGLELSVNEKTKALQQKIEELEKTNRIMMGRELKMVELKEEINRMKKNLDSLSDMGKSA